MGSFSHACSVFEKFGFKATGRDVKTTEPIDFLSRIFVSQVDSEASICDLKRALKKMHIGMNKLTPDITSLGNKIRGYAVTDPNTLCIKNLARKFKELYPEDDDSGVDVERAFKIDMGPWPGEVCESIQLEILSKNLGMDVAGFLDALGEIDKCTDLQKLGRIFPNYEHAPVDGVIINGHLTNRSMKPFKGFKKRQQRHTMKRKSSNVSAKPRSTNKGTVGEQKDSKPSSSKMRA
jgi:hypothetical protein